MLPGGAHETRRALQKLGEDWDQLPEEGGVGGSAAQDICTIPELSGSAVLELNVCTGLVSSQSDRSLVHAPKFIPRLASPSLAAKASICRSVMVEMPFRGYLCIGIWVGSCKKSFYGKLTCWEVQVVGLSSSRQIISPDGITKRRNPA